MNFNTCYSVKRDLLQCGNRQNRNTVDRKVAELEMTRVAKELQTFVDTANAPDQPQNGGGGGLDVYDVRDYSLTREANNLKLVASILPFEDELHINQRYTATVRLRNGEDNTFGGGGGASPLFARSECACIMGADDSPGNAMTSTGEGSISSFDATGFAVFSDVSFTMPCVAQRVVLVNPFLESVSTPPFLVSPPYSPGSSELPALSRLQIRRISSISTVVHSPVIESGKLFYVSLRHVNCWGEDAGSCPRDPSPERL